jgi:hypothetical protein
VLVLFSTPGRLVTAYSNDATREERVPLAVELPYSTASNGKSATWLWQQMTLPVLTALGSAKIRAGYDYRELYARPTASRTHSVCPGDCFMGEAEQDAAEEAELGALVYR